MGSARILADDWQPVRLIDPPSAALVAQIAPPVRVVQERTTTLISRSPDGQVVYDFGQNLVGRVRLTVQGEAGDEIVLHHAEVLDQQGEVYLDNLRTAQQEVRYILKGPGKHGASEQYEPCFTFQGFRYVAVKGLRGEPDPDLLTALVIHSDMEPTRRIRMLRTAAQPAAAQHCLGPEGQLPRRAHRLPPA